MLRCILLPIPSVIIIASSIMTTTNVSYAQTHNIEQQQLSYTQINQNLSKSVLYEFPVSPGSHPHDVAPLPKGGIVLAKASGKLGWLDPNTGSTHEIALGQGTTRPHGVIIGLDGGPWITDGALKTIVRVDPHHRHSQHGHSMPHT
jgi:streptogramin lyase